MNGTVNGVDDLADEIERKVSLEHHDDGFIPRG